MPRIEVIPDDFDPDRGDGSPTHDLCRSCSRGIEQGDDVTETPLADHHKEGGYIGVTDCGHPAYGDGSDPVYVCEACHTPLTDEDD